MPNKINILLAEDQHLTRQALAHLLSMNPQYDITASVANGLDVLSFLETASVLPDLCVLDIQMPHLNGVECGKLVRRHYPSIKLILLTSAGCEFTLENGLFAEVNGYILKESSFESFCRMVDLVLEGQFVAPWELMQAITNRLKHFSEREQESRIDDKLGRLAQSHSLEEKDLEIIRYIGLGWTNRMIADEIYISEGTVKNQLTRIYRKLKISSRTELLALLGAANR